jgi:hypothetical protein
VSEQNFDALFNRRMGTYPKGSEIYESLMDSIRNWAEEILLYSLTTCLMTTSMKNEPGRRVDVRDRTEDSVSGMQDQGSLSV